MKYNRSHRSLRTTMALALVAVASKFSDGAMAQSTPAPANNDPDAVQKIPEVLVRGVRPEEHAAATNAAVLRMGDPILNAPRSVRVVDKAVFVDQLVLDANEAARTVSGVAPAGSYTGEGENYIVRGFPQNDLYKDGFRAGEASNAGLAATMPTDMANVNRLEVLKGPVAVEYGRGEPGGIVNYVTELPTFENKFGIQQVLGSYDFYRTDVDANWNAVPDKLALRLDAAYNSNGSWMDHVDGKRYVLAPSFLWKISEKTTLSFRGEFSHDDRSSTLIHPYMNGSVPDGINHGRYFGEPGVTEFLSLGWRGLVQLDHQWNENNKTILSLHGRHAKQDGIYFILYDFAGGPVIDADGDVARAMADINWIDRSTVARAEHSIEFPLFEGTQAAAENKVLVAAEYEVQDDNRHRFLSATPRLNAYDPVYTGYVAEPLVPFPGFPTRVDESSSSEASATSLLLLDRLSFQERVILSFGGRVEWFQADQSFTYGAGAPFPSWERPQYHTLFNPTAGILFKPAKPVSLYFNYSESSSSFRNFALATAPGTVLDPERARQFELGAKTDWLAGRLVASAAVFQINKFDVAGTDPSNPLYSINAGDERSRGVELDLAYHPLPGWKVRGNYSYVDAIIENDPTGANNGNRRYGSPEHCGSFWNTYEFQEGALKGFGFGGGAFFATDVAVDNANTGTLDGYVQADAVAFYRRNNWRVQLNVKNLFDEEYYYAIGQATMVQPAATRTVIGSLRFDF